MDETEVIPRLIRIGVALGVGLTIGLERGWQRRDEAEGSRVAGWRTFGLIGLAGGVWSDVADGNVVAVALALVALTTILAVAHWQEAKNSGDYSATTLVAGLLTFGLGALAGHGQVLEAAACAIVAALVLSVKSELHQWLKRLSDAELRATLQFLLITVVILPILPNRGFGPFGAINPHQVWMMVVIVAGLSFGGYVAMRFWGQQAGLMLTAVLGGVVASTAIAFDFSRRTKANPSLTSLAAAGIAAASGVSFIRTAVLVAVFRVDWLPAVAILVSAMALAASAAAWFLWRGRGDVPTAEPEQLGNPLALRSALQLGATLAVALVLAQWFQENVGAAGLAGFSAVSGMVEIDATTLALSRMVGEGLATQSATQMLLLGLAANGLLKLVVVGAFGGTRLLVRVAASYAAIVLAGAAALFIVP